MIRFQCGGWRTALAAVAAGLIVPIFSGCAGTVDTLTSRRFRESPFRTLFYSDDPMYVLRNVPEADDRERAMRAVKEPKRSGGSQADQDELIQILSASATSDKQFVCRNSAIAALAQFEDPRAAQILVTAYHNAAIDAPEDSPQPSNGVVQASRKTRTAFAPVTSFTPEQIAELRGAALKALSEKRSPEALALLCEVAAAPAKVEVKPSDIEALLQQGPNQEKFDLRMAAIRALANYKGDRQAAVTLYKIMTTERDPGPRNRARIGLMEVTGKDYPWDSPKWPELLQISAEPVRPPAVNETGRNPSAPVKPDRLDGAIGP